MSQYWEDVVLDCWLGEETRTPEIPGDPRPPRFVTYMSIVQIRRWIDAEPSARQPVWDRCFEEGLPPMPRNMGHRLRIDFDQMPDKCETSIWENMAGTRLELLDLENFGESHLRGIETLKVEESLNLKEGRADPTEAELPLAAETVFKNCPKIFRIPDKFATHIKNRLEEDSRANANIYFNSCTVTEISPKLLDLAVKGTYVRTILYATGTSARSLDPLVQACLEKGHLGERIFFDIFLLPRSFSFEVDKKWRGRTYRGGPVSGRASLEIDVARSGWQMTESAVRASQIIQQHTGGSVRILAHHGERKFGTRRYATLKW